jgi:transcriptional regulatory protein LevR
MLLLIAHQVREEYYRLEKRFNIQFNGNCLYALSHYLIHRSRQAPSTMSNEKAACWRIFWYRNFRCCIAFAKRSSVR